MVNFEKGKIYTIRSYKTDLVYVGSTVQPLYKRLDQHKRKYNDWLKTSKTYYSSYEIFKLDDDPYIELVHKYPCSCKDELHKEEGKYIRKIKCVNKNIAGRVKKEYYEDNKDDLIEKAKEYYNLNKDELKEKSKEYYNLNKEIISQKLKEYYNLNKDKIKEKKKEYYNLNKDEIKEKKKEYDNLNKEKRKEKMKDYYKQNKEIISQKGKEKANCPHCNKEMRKDSINKHIKSIHK